MSFLHTLKDITPGRWEDCRGTTEGVCSLAQRGPVLRLIAYLARTLEVRTFGMESSGIVGEGLFRPPALTKPLVFIGTSQTALIFLFGVFLKSPILDYEHAVRKADIIGRSGMLLFDGASGDGRLQPHIKKPLRSRRLSILPDNAEARRENIG